MQLGAVLMLLLGCGDDGSISAAELRAINRELAACEPSDVCVYPNDNPLYGCYCFQSVPERVVEELSEAAARLDCEGRIALCYFEGEPQCLQGTCGPVPQ